MDDERIYKRSRGQSHGFIGAGDPAQSTKNASENEDKIEYGGYIGPLNEIPIVSGDDLESVIFELDWDFVKESLE